MHGVRDGRDAAAFGELTQQTEAADIHAHMVSGLRLPTLALQKGPIVLNDGCACNRDMTFLIVLAAGSVAAIAGTGVLATRDGYRRVPTRRA